MVDWRLFSMGFCPSTHQYKLFRLSFPNYFYYMEDVYMDVYTFGDHGGWRGRRLRLSCCHNTMRSLPVLIKGVLYTVTGPSEYGGTLLAIDVASEAVLTHGLPRRRIRGMKTAVDVLELHGRPCVAIHELDVPRPKLTFWVLTIDLHVPGSQNKDNDINEGWEDRKSVV